ncbi:hypothetical protein FVR03_07880 [Pontibacter qinzhouensis]|uniref:DUF3575 domain-containing protein n=1 Tax=Pontibacter qinzhouensis TaxID=2603253 RepID=A0A5C8K9S7_9BACT|nr:hypothetical protein [Pontibacter qinzhouensis]TXK48608.1 hypothetical protein FVR03_07880 [Pontibacter qinzhouensis]
MKTILTSIVLLTLLVAPSAVKAQEADSNIKRNTVYVELLGNGGFYSLNFDRILVNRENWKIAGRVGVTYFNHFDNYSSQVAGVPLELSYLRGKGNHYFEAGLGLNPVYRSRYNFNKELGKQHELNIWANARLGYRYQKREGGVFYRIAYTPILSKTIFSKNESHPSSTSWAMPVWFGLSIGKTLQ